MENVGFSMDKLKLSKPRRIISSDYSFLISLPHRWLDHHNLTKGDLVDFEVDKKGNLIIIPCRIKNDKINPVATGN